MASLEQCFIFDVDGTLALHAARNPYQWRDADDDLPNRPVVVALRALNQAGYKILYVSGRPEEARELTLSWLGREVGVLGPLFLRPDGDNRKDFEIKSEIYRREIEPKFDVVAVFDDRDQVIRMWRDQAKLTCFQVADGNF